MQSFTWFSHPQWKTWEKSYHELLGYHYQKFTQFSYLHQKNWSKTEGCSKCNRSSMRIVTVTKPEIMIVLGDRGGSWGTRFIQSFCFVILHDLRALMFCDLQELLLMGQLLDILIPKSSLKVIKWTTCIIFPSNWTSWYKQQAKSEKWIVFQEVIEKINLHMQTLLFELIMNYYKLFFKLFNTNQEFKAMHVFFLQYKFFKIMTMTRFLTFLIGDKQKLKKTKTQNCFKMISRSIESQKGIITIDVMELQKGGNDIQSVWH